ncbi:hypothetical protein [Nostoc sp. 'Peltigera membranacea cyanobiont' 210A]|nr:hypothetical protein [Nostoc sp. 'Peltigera membranacea cyanobiont' 210A]
MAQYVRVGVARRRHRISQIGFVPSLAEIIREKSFLHPLGWSW